MNRNKYLLILFLSLTKICCVSADEALQSFAVIGDYGNDSPNEKAVADLVASWKPQFILTVGDNNYEYGSDSTIDPHIGKYYHSYIGNYIGSFGEGSVENRFYPSLGNHDWEAKDVKPYLNYFSLPGNERYYDFVKGDIHFFVIDSDPREPDGVDSTSVQALWLKDILQQSREKWKIVYFHHPPFCSGVEHGSSVYMRWPFKSWGASAVLAGHEHLYERFVFDGLPYFVNGIGGKSLYRIITPLPESIVHYNANYGAMRITEYKDKLVFTEINILGEEIDSYTLPVPK